MRRLVYVRGLTERAGAEEKARCDRHLQFDRDKDCPVSLNLSGIREKTRLIAVDRVRLVHGEGKEWQSGSPK